MMAHYALFFSACRYAGATYGQLAAFYCTGYAWQGIYLGFFFGLSHFAVERVPVEELHPTFHLADVDVWRLRLRASEG